MREKRIGKPTDEAPTFFCDSLRFFVAMKSFQSQLIRSSSGKWLLGRAADIYDSRICTLDNVRRQAQGRRDAKSYPLRFSVGIPHFNRGAQIFRPLFNLLCHPAVEEIVIVDDGSAATEFAALERTVAEVDPKGRVKIHRREQNLGALRTKLECVERASSDWVLILDSDNTAFTRYLDTLASQRALKPDTIYCASWAFPFFSFHELGGQAMGFETAAELTATKVLRRIYLINDGNYLVHRESYVRSVGAMGSVASDVADVMLVNYHWLSQGGLLQILPGTTYYHRVHKGSFWNLTQEESRKRVVDLFVRFERRLKWDEEFACSLSRLS